MQILRTCCFTIQSCSLVNERHKRGQVPDYTFMILNDLLLVGRWLTICHSRARGDLDTVTRFCYELSVIV